MSDSQAAPAPVQTVNLFGDNNSQVDSTPATAKVQTPAEAKPPEDKFASKFAALTRKEREFREAQGKWKSESESIKTEAQKAKEEAQQMRDKYGRFASLEETVKTDKKAGLKWLLEQGASVEELSDALLEEMNPSPEAKLQRSTSEVEKRLMAKLAELEGKLTAKEQAEIEAAKNAEKANYEKTVTQVKGELTEYIKSSDAYTLINLSGDYDTPFEVMQYHYNQQVENGTPADKIKLLSYEEAAQMTESYLEEDANTKYEAKRAKQAPPAKPEPKKTTQTLSNTLSTEVPNSAETKQLTREESLKRSAQMIKFND